MVINNHGFILEGTKSQPPALKTRAHEIAVGELHLLKLTRASKSDQDGKENVRNFIIKNRCVFAVGEFVSDT